MSGDSTSPEAGGREHRPKRSAVARPAMDMADRIGPLVLAAATVGGITVCVLIAAPFLSAVTWALTLAIVFAPLHSMIERRLKRRNASAIISVSIIALVITVPAAFVGARLVERAASGATLVQASIGSGTFQHILDGHPSIAPIGSWIEQHFDLRAMLASLAAWLSDAGASFARVSVIKLIGILMTFYLLYYFLRDRYAAAAMLEDWLPLTKAESTHLFRRVIDTVHATIYGTLAMAVVQGVLGGLMFWFLGLSTPLFWGLLMGLLTIVPVVGAVIVWLPMAIVLALGGSWGQAAILTVFGVVVVVGGIHNVLYPMVVGNRLRLHTVPAFISMIGGLILFGSAGFILGPLAVTTTILLLDVWRERAKTNNLQYLK